MARKFIMLLITVVTFQFSWMAMSVYCGHETGRAARHFGHHQHTESADELTTVDQDKSSALAKKLTPHAHCASCSHANVALAGQEAPPLHPFAVKSDPSMAMPVLVSAYTPPPERPQWHLAA